MKEDVTQQEYILINLLETVLIGQVCRIKDILYKIEDITVVTEEAINSMKSFIKVSIPMLSLGGDAAINVRLEVDVDVFIGMTPVQEIADKVFSKISEEIQLIDPKLLESKAFRTIYL